MSSSRQTQNTQAPAQHPRRRTHRPASISELKQKALSVELDLTQEFKRCLKETEMWRNKGRDYLEKGDLERAFMLFARSATMALDTLPLHPQYMTNLKEHQRQNLSWHGQEILDQMGEIKPVLVHRFSEWRTAHPNEPLAPLDRLDNEDPEEADRNWSQRERAKAEEAAQLRRQQEDTQRHADEFRMLQRTSSSRPQLDRRKDNALNSARQAASTPRYNPPEADHSSSRPPIANGSHGSQSTIVVMPEPSAKRDRDEKRRIEQEGIKRRQQEAEAEAQQIRQVIAVNNTLPHGPQHPQQPESNSISTHSSASSFATNASSQSSLFPQSQPSSLATTPASSFHHTQYQSSQPPPATHHPSAATVPPTTPVRTTTQADPYYPQTPNTQPRKGLVEADVSVLFPGLSPVDVNRTPTRATLRG
ncbi:hypothetical protein AGABI2DRAFT_121015 [Agaricus bisporus var. bisporus H97]|uniref:hypothetical protein n=1 Tax=Agaricus bisporus var. bisporus (strain H97 / ATCC MYA-4626 / FGSC 10389) TaxID=936046 RepID=UPI00029F78D2|nr:hypothetical protein AGABI2DRAFT_121015 [Agaricus bisporus var. bisporus H97]EKV43801.1 hypothetical protein AGABI2DRAFT_121015 [Agaricus bisporus var. bisporus H97]